MDWMARSKLQKQKHAKTVYDLQAEICGALASPIRLRILDVLASGEVAVSDLIPILEIPKANLSQHLNVLKEVGIIQTRKEGLFQYVSLMTPKIKDACSIVRSLLMEKIQNEEEKNSQLIKALKGQR